MSNELLRWVSHADQGPSAQLVQASVQCRVPE